MAATPSSREKSDKKRDASSPLDADSMKKSRIGSADSEFETEHCSVELKGDQISQITEILKQSLSGQLTEMATHIISEVVGGLKQTMSDLEQENKQLRDKISVLERRVETLEIKDDKANQYSRKNCLRLSGVAESDNESMDSLATNLFKELGVDVNLGEIDNMHRLARRKPSSPSSTESAGDASRPRDIIIKFATYRARQRVFTGRSNLRNSKSFKGAYLNEELTKQRSSVYYNARKLVKAGRIKSTWTTNGIILVKDASERIYRCECMNDLAKFQAI